MAVLMDKKIAGVVLAGGRSSRMGTNKALLDYRGRSLLEHMTDLLKESGAERVFISGEVDGFDGVKDDVPFAGPAAAISGMLRHLEGKGYGGFLFVPVDMPFLTPDMLRELTKIEKGSCFAGYPLPVYIPVGAGAAGGGFSSVRQMIDRLGLCDILFSCGDARSFCNLNTPEEWREAENER